MIIKVHETRNEDRRGRDRYGHSVRRFTAKDLSFDPDIEIKKIFPPDKEDVEKCRVKSNGSLRVLFNVDGDTYQLQYNPHIEGYDGMASMAREQCTITNLDTKQEYDCTGMYSIPWIPIRDRDFISRHWEEPEVQAYLNPTEKMVQDNFIKPFVKDYLS